VSTLDPRPATASIIDGGAICGRLSRAPYTVPLTNGGLRQRQRNKEIQPPIRFSAQTESERVSDTITNISMFDSGPWEPSVGNDIVWRPISPEKWVGGRFSRVRYERTSALGERSASDEQNGPSTYVNNVAEPVLFSAM